jgi:hypothetical protein
MEKATPTTEYKTATTAAVSPIPTITTAAAADAPLGDCDTCTTWTPGLAMPVTAVNKETKEKAAYLRTWCRYHHDAKHRTREGLQGL